MGAVLSSKILVVDDEVHIVELARLYLTREGYEVEGVGDGAQAMTRFGQLKPDLVILDIMLPGTDGLTICKEIRKQSQVPIIMLTARDEVTDKGGGPGGGGRRLPDEAVSPPGAGGARQSPAEAAAGRAGPAEADPRR